MNEHISNDIEDVLRQMTFGKNYREWSEDTIKKIQPYIEQIIEDDQHSTGSYDESIVIDEDMVVTAMMMALYN